MAPFWWPGSVEARLPCMTGHDGDAGEDIGGLADGRVASKIKGKASNRRGLARERLLTRQSSNQVGPELTGRWA
jgi:hypothetical protein